MLTVVIGTNAQPVNWYEGQVLTLEEYLSLNQGEINDLVFGQQEVLGEFVTNYGFYVKYKTFTILEQTPETYIVTNYTTESPMWTWAISLCENNTGGCYGKLVNANKIQEWEGIQVYSCKKRKNSDFDLLKESILQDIAQKQSENYIQTFLEEGEPEI